MEFKLEGTAEEAIAQIEEKHYAHPFETDSRKLFKIGINFSNKMRNIESGSSKTTKYLHKNNNVCIFQNIITIFVNIII